jgi:deazaflavin-dependent oxidoreductase (nitroreductase family)
MSRLLRPLQRGFLVLNRWFMAPAIKGGLGRLIGNPFTGHLMILRTRGRTTGLLREAPLGYVILDGAVYCVAGYGETTPWFRNLCAEPTVDVVLPDRRFRGRAEPVAEPTEWLRAYRALMSSFGLIGRSVTEDVSDLSDDAVLARHRGLPVVRITPTDPADPIVSGPWDPGGNGWIKANVAALAAGALVWRAVRRRTSTSAHVPVGTGRSRAQVRKMRRQAGGGPKPLVASGSG